MLLLAYRLYVPHMFAVNCPVPANDKEALLYIAFRSNPRDSPAWLSLTPLTYRPRISRGPPYVSPHILMYKISRETAILQSVFSVVEILLPGDCHQFGSNRLIKILYGCGHFFCRQSNEPCFTVQRSTCCFSFLQFPRPGTLGHFGGGEGKNETKDIEPAPRKRPGRGRPHAPCLVPRWHLHTREPEVGDGHGWAALD